MFELSLGLSATRLMPCRDGPADFMTEMERSLGAGYNSYIHSVLRDHRRDHRHWDIAAWFHHLLALSEWRSRLDRHIEELKAENDRLADMLCERFSSDKQWH